MTLATLICTNCQTAYAVTSRSVVLPFVCSKCEPKKCADPACVCQHDPEFTDDVPVTPVETPDYSNFASMSLATTPDNTVVETPVETPDCNDASVEATTALIDDLTKQLEGERATVMAGDSRIAELEMQLIEARATVTEYGGLLAKMTKYCSDLGNYIEDDCVKIADLFGRNIELLAELDETHEQEEKSYRVIAKLLNENCELAGKVEFAGEVLTSLYATKVS
jgi:hypothetical protein